MLSVDVVRSLDQLRPLRGACKRIWQLTIGFRAFAGAVVRRARSQAAAIAMTTEHWG